MAILSSSLAALSLSSPPTSRPYLSQVPPLLLLPATPSRRRGKALTSTVLATAARGAAPTAQFDGESLLNVSVLKASDSQPVLLSDLWDQTEEIAVVPLLRHFGCPCCWELAADLRDSISRFDSAGVKLCVIGVGTPDKARILAERLPFPAEYLYADPQRKAYDILGLYYGFGRTFFNPASAKVLSSKRFDSLRKATKNYTTDATPDDRGGVLQQGGMFVFKGKQLIYARKDEGTGDHASLDEILDICCKAPVS